MVMKPFAVAGLPPDELNSFLSGTHADPFRILGPHRMGDDLAIRAFRPDARKIDIVQNRQMPVEAEKIHRDGFFQAKIPNATRELDYHLRVTNWDGSQYAMRDPYQYGPIMGEVDLHLFNEGQHWQLYEKFGSHMRKIGDAAGVYFSVWAPNAQRVSVVGDFNGWDGRVNPMRKLLGSGVWELFLPGVKEGAHYKFEIRAQSGALLLKSDPFAFFNQHGTSTSSLVYNLERYQWSDADWMTRRRSKEWPKSPISIYEVHLGSWQRKPDEGNRPLSYLELAEVLLPYVLEMGYTHIELLPIAEHPFEGSWGYQVTNYYALTSRNGNLDAIYFLKKCNEVCYERFPGIVTIAEESTAWPGVSRPVYLGGLGFGFKWNMGWMHDFLEYMSLDPIYRRFHHGNITFSLLYAFTEHFILVLSHDEVVHGKRSLLSKMPGDEWRKFANLRMFYAWMYGHPGKKLLFMGGEFGQGREWNHDSSLDWHLVDLPKHDGLRRLVQHLNYIYKSEPALWQHDDSYEGFDWIDFHVADNSVVSFVRKSREGEIIVFVVNSTPVVRPNYRLVVPRAGLYRAIRHTDAETYGGGNVGNLGGVQSEDRPWMGRDHSILMQLPPLATLAFKPDPGRV